MTSYNQALKFIKSLIKKHFLSDKTGHDYYHFQRVAKQAIRIGHQEKANLQVLELSAWLHDLGMEQGKLNHEVRSSQQAKIILTRFNLPQPLINQVCSCILEHRFSKNKPPRSLESKILQDADKLDAIGAIAISRLFTYAGKIDQTAHIPNLKPNFKYYQNHNGHSNTSINHFYDKLLKLKNLLHTKTAKTVAKQRHQFMKTYLNQFLAEWDNKK